MKLCLRLNKVAFFNLKSQATSRNHFEDVTQVYNMLFDSIREDKYITEVNTNEGDSTKKLVHNSLNVDGAFINPNSINSIQTEIPRGEK